MNIFLDGSWNTPKDNSNIVRMHKKYGGKYFKGVGTKGLFLDRILGGAFGYGSEAIVDDAYKFYVKNYRGDGVKICGFSRGAAEVRMLAAKIGKQGGKVDFIGCFDTVSAYGIPLGFWPFTFYDDLFHNMDVHPNVITAAHVQALDEHRAAFIGTPMEEREGVTQIGMRGDHWAIGSGDASFNWMCEQFENVKEVFTAS